MKEKEGVGDKKKGGVIAIVIIVVVIVVVIVGNALASIKYAEKISEPLI